MRFGRRRNLNIRILAEAAQAVGYEDVSGFNRQFLRAYKIPPRRYRLMHRAK